MTAVNRYTLYCDGIAPDGAICAATWRPAAGDSDSATRQRRAARAAGWQVARKTAPRDVCPGQHLPYPEAPSEDG